MSRPDHHPWESFRIQPGDIDIRRGGPWRVVSVQRRVLDLYKDGNGAHKSHFSLKTPQNHHEQ